MRGTVSIATHIALLFSCLDCLCTLRRRLDIGRRRDSLGGCIAHELLHVVEVGKVGLALLAHWVLVLGTNDHLLDLWRGSVGDRQVDERKGNVTGWQRVEEYLHCWVDLHHWGRATGARAVGVAMPMFVIVIVVVVTILVCHFD